MEIHFEFKVGEKEYDVDAYVKKYDLKKLTLWDDEICAFVNVDSLSKIDLSLLYQTLWYHVDMKFMEEEKRKIEFLQACLDSSYSKYYVDWLNKGSR